MTLPREDYGYPPIEARSPQARARLSVHPCPERGWWDLFRSTLYAHQLFVSEHGYRGAPEAGYRSPDSIERLLWRVERRSACPWAGFVHDDGTCAVLHADDELVFFDQRGALTGKCNVLGVMSKDPSLTPYLQHSTAGTFWTDVPAGFFVETRRGLLFSLRLAQRVRLCFDPASGTRDKSAEATPEIPGAERAQILDLLEAALDQGDLQRAGMLALFAGQDGIAEATPLILSLEARAKRPESTLSNQVWTASCSRARLQAQTALVRLGARFVPANAFQDLEQPRPKDWHSALERLRPGATSHEIFQAAGAPFFSDSYAWEYDVVRDGRYLTLRLELEGNRIRRIRWVEDAFRGIHRDV